MAYVPSAMVFLPVIILLLHIAIHFVRKEVHGYVL